MLLGQIGSAEFHIGADQYKLWEHTQLIIDVVQGRGASFSLEIPEGVRFLTRGRMFTDAELTELGVSAPARADATLGRILRFAVKIRIQNLLGVFHGRTNSARPAATADGACGSG